MSADEVVRLAWQADRDGRPRLRDALLLLALAESGPDEAVAAERCRKFLIAGRADHWLASFPTLGQALAHPKVAGEVDRLRAMYPPVRIQRLLLRGEVQRGPFTGRRRSLTAVIDDFGPAASLQEAQDDNPPAFPFAPAGPARAVPEPLAEDPAGLVAFYLGVLLAIALLLASVQPVTAHDSRAA